MRRIVRNLSTAAVVAFALSGCATAQVAQPTLPEVPLTVGTAHGKVHLTVEVARTDEELERGLMFRTAMAPDAGMLFVFRRPDMESFWMENTILPLDMVFIRADGTISSIHDHAVPYDRTPISSTEPVRYVLEINAGRAAALGLAPDEKLVSPAMTASR